jgi:hypothetical protein
MKRRMITIKIKIKKHNEGLKPWSLHLNLNKVTHELIGPRTNNILLITWGSTMRQEVLKVTYELIGPPNK